MLVEHKCNHIPDICLVQFAHSRLKGRDNLRFDVGHQRDQQCIPGPKVVLECTQLHTARPRECSHAETAVPLIGNELNRRSQDFSFSVTAHHKTSGLIEDNWPPNFGKTKSFPPP